MFIFQFFFPFTFLVKIQHTIGTKWSHNDLSKKEKPKIFGFGHHLALPNDILWFLNTRLLETRFEIASELSSIYWENITIGISDFLFY